MAERDRTIAGLGYSIQLYRNSTQLLHVRAVVRSDVARPGQSLPQHDRGVALLREERLGAEIEHGGEAMVREESETTVAGESCA